MTRIVCSKRHTKKYLFCLVIISFLTACGGSSTSTETVAEGEKANWSFKWDDGSVWQ